MATVAFAVEPRELLPPPHLAPRPARPRTSIVLVSFNSSGALLRCLATIDQEVEAVGEIVIVNNGDPGPELEIAARSPRVRIITPERNLGFGAGCNTGAEVATGEVVVFLNPDTIAMPGSITALVDTLDDETVGIAMARVRLLREPELLNSRGNVVHISGLGWSGGFGDLVDDAVDVREVASPCGAAMAVRRDEFLALGGFREELFLYYEDQDLGWRMRMTGRRIVMNCRADVYHEFEFDRHERKRYFLERNRLAFVLIDFSLRTILVLLPVLLATELSMMLLAWRQGWLREKLAGSLWCVGNLRLLLALRWRTQRLRSVPDRQLVQALTPVIDPRAVPVPALVRLVINPLLSGYWALAQRVI